MSAYLILVCAVVGVIINIGAIIVIRRKKDKSMFHDLLNIMSAADVGVVICFALLHAMPDLWTEYRYKIHSHILQFLLPTMHIAVMTSVYSTILIR